jgi:hypothetical protein
MKVEATSVSCATSTCKVWSNGHRRWGRYYKGCRKGEGGGWKGLWHRLEKVLEARREVGARARHVIVRPFPVGPALRRVERRLQVVVPAPVGWGRSGLEVGRWRIVALWRWVWSPVKAVEAGVVAERGR